MHLGNHDKQNKKNYDIVMIDPKTPDATQRQLALFQFIYSILGLFVGFAFAFAVFGVILFYKGVTGASDWNFKIPGVSSSITNAAPGTILFVAGLIIIYISAFKFIHKKFGK